jgi:hypothetical protein
MRSSLLSVKAFDEFDKHAVEQAEIVGRTRF